MSESGRLSQQAAEQGVGPQAYFWSALEDGYLAFQHCDECGRAFHRPRVVCPCCGSTGWEWRRSDGVGHVYSLTQVAQPLDRTRGRCVVALIDLAEGFRVLARQESETSLEVGARVRVKSGLDPEGLPAIVFSEESA